MKSIRRLARWILRDEIAEWDKAIKKASEPELIRMELDEHGLSAAFKHPWAVQLMAEAFADTLLTTKAPNYCECSFRDRKSDMELIVTVQKVNGKTPHQLRMEAEAKLAALQLQS